MKTKLTRNLSANTLQLIINQFFGAVTFYVLSVNIDKNSFGQINLVLAILLAVFNIISLGIDQVVIKKIANGDDPEHILSLYTFHVILSGLLFYGILLTGKLLFAQHEQLYNLLLFIGLGKLMVFLSAPLKQVCSGMERFGLLSYMLIISNIVKGIGLLILALSHLMSINNIVIVFITGDVLEFLSSVILFRRYIKVPVVPRFNKAGYSKLVHESLPQVGVVLITSALARFDWLFIGFMVSAVKLAEYSFAYKIFEISTLPLLAIAPLLIPRFTRLFKNADSPDTDLEIVIRFEIIVAAATGLLLNLYWNPVVDVITQGKYGAVNTSVIFILSLCIPFLYLNNFLWTIFFVQNRLKMILRCFLTTFCVNVAGDLILIPFFNNEGAAVAFLLACLTQGIFYFSQNGLPQLKDAFYTLLLCIACACLSGLVTQFVTKNPWLTGFTAMVIFCVFLRVAGQIKPGDHKRIGYILNL
ncbi:MAG TPA: oligosaccharide flippase family protein [Mucilaginibacter sp.]